MSSVKRLDRLSLQTMRQKLPYRFGVKRSKSDVAVRSLLIDLVPVVHLPVKPPPLPMELARPMRIRPS